MGAEWNQFLDDVKAARADLGNPRIVWYRGQLNASWSLIPSLLRVPNGLLKERDAFLEFRRSATRLFEKRYSQWETLFDMQHYGIPTRLLDWSEVLGITVAFIVHSDQPLTGDAAVYLLDPVALNRFSGVDGVKSLPDDASFEYQNIYWEKKPFAAVYPVAVYPPLQSARLFAQRGVFTVHGDDRRSLDVQCPAAVRKVVLPKLALDDAREFLEHANLDEYSIYPDIVGMAHYLRRKVFG